MRFDKCNQAADTVGECLAWHPELALHGTDVAHAFRTFLEDREMLATQTAAKRVCRIQWKTTLTLECSFDGVPDFPGWHRLDELAVEARRLDCAHNLVLG